MTCFEGRYISVDRTLPYVADRGQYPKSPSREGLGWVRQLCKLTPQRSAKSKQARISASSKSGKSSKISLALTFSASISKISTTRMRIPRMQGRPPHWPGVCVMRFSKSMVEFISLPIEIGLLSFYRVNATELDGKSLTLPTPWDAIANNPSTTHTPAAPTPPHRTATNAPYHPRSPSRSPSHRD